MNYPGDSWQRRLAAAVLAQAAKDCLRGDRGAIHFLSSAEAADLLCSLDIDPHTVRRWLDAL